jgi:hypothetical protein
MKIEKIKNKIKNKFQISLKIKISIIQIYNFKVHNECISNNNKQLSFNY